MLLKEVGLQLYSLRDETAKDFRGTIGKVAEMGYTGVEFAGYGGLKSSEMILWWEPENQDLKRMTSD